MDTDIDFAGIEKRWQDRWAAEKAFEVSDSASNPYYVLEMFPYPSGSGLHMGHAWNYTIGDILARFKRMSGFNVLHPMGYDSLGLPAENAAIEAGKHPDDYTNESIPTFMKQQKEIGLSYDWSRTLSSHDSSYYRWDQWIFLKMLEKGLAYQKVSAVNWCDRCNTVLANEQVTDGKCWRHDEQDVEVRQLRQWFFKTTEYADELYENLDNMDWPERTKAMQKNWIGKSHGTEIEFEINDEKWPIFTTRPDTIFGVTFMVVAAQHAKLDSLVTEEQREDVDNFLKKLKSVSEKDASELEKEGVFTGSYAVNPANGEKVPVYAGNFVVADYGAGMVMAVPAHDRRDWKFAQKMNQQYGMTKLYKDARIKIQFVVCPKKEFFDKYDSFEDYSRSDGYGEFGTSNIEGNASMQTGTRMGISETFDEHKKRVIKEIKSGKCNWNYTGRGVLISSGEFDGMGNVEAKKKITDWLIEKGVGKRVVNFKLRDWGISRQRYWGTPIPIVHCEKCGAVPVAEKDLPVVLPKDVKFGDGNPLETSEEWLNVECPKCGGKGRRESDTMDTFVNSSWYFLRYCDANNDKEIFDPKKVKYWCPVDTYIGGAEHACMHLIYSRFYVKFLRDLGLLDFDEPAVRLFHQGMLSGEGGVKMSKSKPETCVLPEDVSNKYGMDTARFFLSSLASPDKDIDWSEKGISGSSRFVSRIFGFFEDFKSGSDSDELLSRLNRTIRNVGEYYGNFEYRKATIEVRGLFDLVEKGCSVETAGKFLKLLSPICPHITEELWEKIGNTELISISSWPDVDEKKILEKGAVAGDLNGKIVERILGIVKDDTKKVFVYVMPFEIGKIDVAKIEKDVGKSVEVFAVNDSEKVDPKGVAKKAKPGMAAIYLE